jgi:Caspase domain
MLALDPRLALRVLSCLSVAALLASPAPAAAETRRALLIGIDRYTVTAAQAPSRQGFVNGSSARQGRPLNVWSDLEGAVNDVEALRQVLVARYGFKADDVHLLTNAEATRNRILTDTRKWLIDSASSGDVSFFFYAGHGSQVKNTRSDEADKLDESIVPADANRGALDVRDKELAALFGQALDKNVLLTAMFDSCHSGSIARGVPRAMRIRYVRPDERDVADPSKPSPPETRGALVLSATQDYQPAAEIEDEQKRPHGLFSWALLHTLRSMPVNQSADRVFLQIRALIQSGQLLQEPVLATTTERRRAPLFGVGTQASGTIVVAVQNRESDGSVILQGGIAAGIRKDAELRQVGDRSGTPLSLRVTEEQGLSRSKAIVINGGTTDQVAPGTLFEMVRWTAAGGPALRVWIGSTAMPTAEVRRQASAMAAISSAAGGTLIDDPTTSDTRSHLLQWDDAGWRLITEGAQARTLGPHPAAAALAPLLAAGPDGSRRLIVSLPLPSQAAAALALGAGSENDAIEVLSSPDNADYMLVGRAQRNAIEYAWVRPNVTGDDTKASALPARTEWVPLGDDGGDELGGRLRQHALRLGAIRSWAQLEPPANAGRFPYHLALKNTATGNISTTGPTRGRQTYDLVLVFDDAMARSGFDRRFVYVFAMDSDGRSQLLFPARDAGAVENRLPIGVTKNGPPKEITLQTFTVSEPYGVDTFMMLTTATQLADPTVLEGDAVRARESTRAAADPLTRLLAQTGSGKRGRSTSTPTDWSFERLTIQSVAP